MNKTVKLSLIIGLPVLALGIGGYVATPLLSMGAGYAAKYAGSAVFVGGRTLEDVEAQELSDLSWMSLVSYDIDGNDIHARALFGLIHRRARFRPGFGVTLLADNNRSLTPESLWEGAPPKPTGMQDHMQDQPVAKTPDALAQAIAKNFEHDKASGFRTRAVVVRHKGRILGERYASGYDKDSVLLGWSMTKSVTGTLIGILSRQGKLDIKKPAPVPEWREAGDPRGKITLDQLLRMSSGLQFGEVYTSPEADAAKMLFASDDMAAFAASQPLAGQPESIFNYSSGTTNILSRIVRDAAGGSSVDCMRFVHRQLFAPLGMNKALIEVDAAGNFVGSSYMHATARGWSRYGQLHLDDGVWRGQRLLPEGWVKYVSTPTPPAPMGEYGGQFWLNHGKDGKVAFADVPRDAYAAQGHAGQIVAIVPSKQAVVVRLAADVEGKLYDWNRFLTEILKALPE